MRSRRRAFTLVELLVVVGIISILIAFLLPALSKARDAAGSVSCLAQTRSLGQSFVMYNNDWRNRYPLGWYWEYAVGPGAFGKNSEHFAHYFVGGAQIVWTWKDALYPYQPSLRGWQCPRQEFLTTPVGGVTYTIAGYVMNGSAAGGGIAGLDPGNPGYVFEHSYLRDQWVNVTRVRNKDRKVLIGCAAQGYRADGALCAGFPLGHFGTDPPVWAVYEQYNTYPAPVKVIWGKHKSGCPVVFVDQHGELLTATQNFCSLTGDSDKWLNVYK